MPTGDKPDFVEKVLDWFDDHPSAFSALMGTIILVFVLFAVFFWISCPSPGYKGNFLTITPDDLTNVAWKKTPKKTQVWAPPTISTLDFYQLIDQKTDELEKCLKGLNLLPLPTIHRDWFAVYVPTDWYTSTCTKEQMIPSSIDYRLCEKKKRDGEYIKIPEHCRYVVKPTELCPCPCNARAAIKMGPVHVIVTAPNLKLFKAELARVVLWPKYNMPWVAPVSGCLN